MNVTNDRFKNRQLHIEDYRQMVFAKQKKYAKVFAYQRIAENNNIITDFWTDNLMGLILRKDNLNKAYKKVKSNKGAGGIDGMQVDKLLPYLRENQDEQSNRLNWVNTNQTQSAGLKYPKKKKARSECWEYQQ
jgi:RNA-directed DNA polymerase